MNQRPSNHPRKSDSSSGKQVRDRLVNECLDSIIEGDAGMARAMIRASSEIAAGADRDVAELRRLMKPLSKVPNAPDLTARILAETHRRRPFLPCMTRHRISVWRVALAASFLGLITGGYLVSESWSSPISDDLSASNAGGSTGPSTSLASVSAAESLQHSLFESFDEAPPVVVATAPLPKRRLLSLGDVDGFAPQRTWKPSEVQTDSVVASKATFSTPIEFGGSPLRSSNFELVSAHGPVSVPLSGRLWVGGANGSLLKSPPLPDWLLTGDRYPSSRNSWGTVSPVWELPPTDSTLLPRLDLGRLLADPD